MNTSQSLDILSPQEQIAVRTFLHGLGMELGDQLQQTVLFGSKARKDDDPDSDIDILIVVNKENRTLRNAISNIGSRVSLEYDVLIGPFIIAQDRWEQMKREKFSLCENVARDGIPLAF